MLAPGPLRAERMKRLRVVAGEEHGHDRQLRASAAYAPAWLRAVQPKSFSPPPVAASGALVVDVFPGVRGREAIEAAAAAAGLRETPPADALAALDAELARLAAAAAPPPARKLA